MLSPFHKEIKSLAFVYAHCGLKFDGKNRIYSIAGAVIDTNQSTKRFESMLHYGCLSAREKYYSNVSKEMMLNTPDPNKVSQKLKTFLKNQSFIFAFDPQQTIEELGEFCGGLRIIDLSFAAEFFFPYLESYTPRRIWELIFEKNRDKVSFTAMEMVDLSTDFIKYLCTRYLNDQINPQAPTIRWFLQKSNTLFGNALIHITQNYKDYFGGQFNPYTAQDTKNWKQFLEKALSFQRKKNKPLMYQAIPLDHIEERYQTMSLADKTYKFRKEQVTYAVYVAQALNDGAVLTLEAGTGTGKTQGYLIPVMEFLYQNPDARVVISTYTKSLQQQIFQREIAFTQSIFKHYQDIPVSLLKGKSSYICAEKLDHLYEGFMEGKPLLAWLYFVNLLFHFRSADGDTLGEKVKYYLNRDFYLYKLLSDISAKTGCKASHKHCPAQVITAEAYKARLIVTNHHKLVLLDKDNLLSGLFNNCIIDEANHFENAVRSALGEEVNSWEIINLISSLENSITRILKRAKGIYAQDIEMALNAVKMLRHLIQKIRIILAHINSHAGPGETHALQYDHPNFKHFRVDKHIKELRDDLLTICDYLEWTQDPDACRQLKIVSRTKEKIKLDIYKLNEYAVSLKVIEKSLDVSDKVTAYQYFKKNWILSAQPVEVSDLIRSQIYAKKNCIIYTAATLCYKKSFDNFKEIAGLDKPFLIGEQAKPKKFRFCVIPSPFSKNAMEIMVPKNAVNGKFDNKNVWIDSLIKLLPDFIEQNKGRTLILFSSYSDLKWVAEHLSNLITQYPLLIQQKGSATINLCDEFRNIKESVLLGVDTFWYGVDFKGDTLTQVIITRIPYPSPSDPIQMAKKKTMSPKAFWSRYYYDTEIKMKQGMGRLIRSDTDAGRVVVLDSRYRVDKY